MAKYPFQRDYFASIQDTTAPTPCERFFHASTATDYTQRRVVLIYSQTLFYE